MTITGLAPATVTAQGRPPSANPNEQILAKLDEINAKLDKLEKRLPCPLDEYIEGTCTENPAGTSVTYCISQGRSGGLAGKFALEVKGKVEGGGRWDVVGLADAHGEVNVPLALAFIPFPTELALEGSAGLGRGFDICVEVPLRAADTDSDVLDRIVKGMNPPSGAGDTKFQRRLTRLLRFADRRVPEPVTADVATRTATADDVDFDVVDDAMERFMAGELLPTGEPLGLLKDPVVQTLRSVLEIPEPFQLLLDDPDRVFETLPALAHLEPGQICDAFGLSGAIAARSPAIAGLCATFASLPSFETTRTAYDVIHTINMLMAELPDEVLFGVADLLPDPKSAGVPKPRPAGSSICTVFPRLCR